MVGRRNTLLVTKRSLRNADSAAGKRPKRAIQVKHMEETVGMSRQEEQELNKALYASLQENRRSKSMPSLLDHGDECNNHNSTSHVAYTGKNTSSANSGRHSLPSGSKSSKTSLGQRRSLRVGMSSPLRRLKRTHKRIRPASASPSSMSRSKLSSNLSIDESSQDSARSSASSANGSKRKIHAQRKFAQGCSLPGTPSSTPAKLATQPVKKISSRIPKTEDFLTFLCFRGTSALPPHLDFFNYSREELASQDEGLKSGSSNKAKRQREGTPDSSSTSSGANEEVAEAADNVNTPIPAGKGNGGSSLLAKRSAARASAGTPETARGIVSLRQGLQRKVSSSSSSRSSSPRFPVASTSSLFSQAQQASSCSPAAVLTNTVYSNPLQPTRNYRPKFYFTPEKSPSPSKASGVRPGEFTPPSMRHGSFYFGSVRNFSPLVCHPTSDSASPRSTPAKSLFSSSSSSYPSSSRSSWSSTTTSGTPKRRKQGIIPLPRADMGKRPTHGAFTPFKTSSQMSGDVTPRSSLSSHPGSHSSHRTPNSASRRVSGSKVQTTAPRSSEVLSARKSLLGKLTSVAQQHAKKILDRSARQREGRAERMAKRLQLKRKLEEEEEEDEDDEEEEEKRNKNRKHRKRTFDGQDYEERKRLRDKGKKTLREGKRSASAPKDRQKTPTRSNRAQHSLRGNSKSGTETHPESEVKEKMKYSVEGRKQNVRGGESKAMRKDSVQAASKPRRPYKVRPIERVRTRGYNLLLASKQAVKRAKKENSAVLLSKKDFELVNLNEKVNEHVETNVEKGIGNIKDISSKKVLDKKVFRMGGSEDKKRNVPLTEDSFSSIATKRSGSIASETDSVPSRRSSRESLASKLSPARIARRNSSSSAQTAGEEKSSIPTFHVTEAEFSDPMAFISKIQPEAEQHGMCRIIPPPSWKLDSGKQLEEVRFTSQVQSIHRLYNRWGPSVQQSAAINQHLMSGQAGASVNSPQMGGVELDLPRLHQLVEEAGGPKKMVDKKDWAKIADLMNIPKQSPDRSDRLYDIYCYHVFPFASLSDKERKQLDSDVEANHKLQTDEEDAIKKGRLMTLSSFSRIARNVLSMWFKEDPTPQQVENEYWKLVEERKRHVTVQCGHINTQAQASGFPTRKDSPYSRHAWNLNNIPGSPGCVLNSLGHVPGVTIPTLHIGMLFSTSCWSSAPHGLPYIQYQHTGAPTIWHCVSKAQEGRLQSKLKDMVPSLVTDKPCWLKEDCLMVNPKHLSEGGVQVERCVQYPGQFVVVFPGAFTSTISCGYNVSESVHFALPNWLPQGIEESNMMNISEERELFSMCSLLCHLVQDEKIEASTLSRALPLFTRLINKELDLRNQLSALGLKEEKREMFSDSPSSSVIANKRRSSSIDDKICDVSNKICYLSLVSIDQGEQTLCIEHGVKYVHRRKNIKSTKLLVRFTQTELETLLREAKNRLISMTCTEGSSTRIDAPSLSTGSSRSRHISRPSSSTS